jgi:hypothetical protein
MAGSARRLHRLSRTKGIIMQTSTHAHTSAQAPFRVAVTGHWSLSDAATVAFVAQAFAGLLRQLLRERPEGVVVLSGLALGADTLFAEAALALGIPLEACIANRAAIEKYAPGPERERHFWLRAQCSAVYELPFDTRSAESYLALGRWLVDSCDLLIAAWNGAAPAKPGGTGDVVAMALAAGRPVLHVHTLRRTIAQLDPGPR